VRSARTYVGGRDFASLTAPFAVAPLSVVRPKSLGIDSHALGIRNHLPMRFIRLPSKGRGS
jgi:hypothetical protein